MRLVGGSPGSLPAAPRTQVAHDLASTIAAEIQSLLQGAAAYIHNQQAWMSICALIKVIHLDPASYPVCLDTITWCVCVCVRPCWLFAVRLG